MSLSYFSQIVGISNNTCVIRDMLIGNQQWGHLMALDMLMQPAYIRSRKQKYKGETNSWYSSKILENRKKHFWTYLGYIEMILRNALIPIFLLN